DQDEAAPSEFVERAGDAAHLLRRVEVSPGENANSHLWHTEPFKNHDAVHVFRRSLDSQFPKRIIAEKGTLLRHPAFLRPALFIKSGSLCCAERCITADDNCGTGTLQRTLADEPSPRSLNGEEDECQRHGNKHRDKPPAPD